MKKDVIKSLAGDSMNNCELCFPNLNPNQVVIYENNSCRLLMLKSNMKKGNVLEGAGIIVTKAHRKSPFDFNEEEWIDIKKILDRAKEYIDKNHQPDGYNIGWNVNRTGGQHLEHAHLHIIPRYSNELLAEKGIRSHLKSENNKRE